MGIIYLITGTYRKYPSKGRKQNILQMRMKHLRFDKTVRLCKQQMRTVQARDGKHPWVIVKREIHESSSPLLHHLDRSARHHRFSCQEHPKHSSVRRTAIRAAWKRIGAKALPSGGTLMHLLDEATE